MRNPSFQKTLLVLALVLGQWLGIAHGFKHVDGTLADTPCEMCLYAHGLDNALPPAAAAPFARLAATHEAPQLQGSPFVARLSAADYPIRGPPVLLA